MWTLVNTELVGGDTLLSFVKDSMERNTIVVGVATEVQIQELITQWEAADAAVVTEEVL